MLHPSLVLILWQISAWAEIEAQVPNLQLAKSLTWLNSLFNPGWNSIAITYPFSAHLSRLKIAHQFLKPGWNFQSGLNFSLYLHVITNFILQNLFWKPGWNFSLGWNSPCNQHLTIDCFSLCMDIMFFVCFNTQFTQYLIKNLETDLSKPVSLEHGIPYKSDRGDHCTF